MAGKGNPKTGGRTKGTGNKATESARATLKRLGLDPFEEAIKVYRGEIKFETVITDKETGAKKVALLPASEQTRFRALVELIKRQYPELKAVEITGPDGDPLPPTRVEICFGADK